MSNLHTGFIKTPNGLEISKDPFAKLFYTFDWSEWLQDGDTIATVSYTVTTRSNDPRPLLKLSEGVTQNFYTFVELSEGQESKIYIVTAEITTVGGLTDRRFFRVNVTPRSA